MYIDFSEGSATFLVGIDVKSFFKKKKKTFKPYKIVLKVHYVGPLCAIVKILSFPSQSRFHPQPKGYIGYNNLLKHNLIKAAWKCSKKMKASHAAVCLCVSVPVFYQ